MIGREGAAGYVVLFGWGYWEDRFVVIKLTPSGFSDQEFEGLCKGAKA